MSNAGTFTEKTTKVCQWCDQPATAKLADRKHTRLASGSCVSSGTSTVADACESCAERLSRRYGAKVLEAA